MPKRAPRMTPLYFHVLLSLSKEARHGYAIMQEVEQRTGGRITLGASSLYYALGRLEDAGLIVETDAPDGEVAPHEERRRYYALTPAGRAHLHDEAATLADIVSHARDYGVIR